MDFQALQTELFARGFKHLNDGGAGLTRAKRWLNWAYHWICEADASLGGTWGFLEATVTGTAPYTFTDLRQVLSVVDTTVEAPLQHIDRRTLLEQVAVDLTDTGTPSYWWLEGEVLKVYPANTSDTLSIRYAKVPTDLSANGDTPLIPARYHDLIVDVAMWRGYKDRHAFEQAQAAKADIDTQLIMMADSLIFRVERGSDTVAQTAFHEDA